MNLPRAIVGSVRCMARPPRPQSERAAVIAAAKRMGCNRSARALAMDIARNVVADAIAYADLDLSDPLIAALAELEAQTTPTPICTLARCPEINTVAEILDRRTALYRARGCRQLSALDREAETRTIAREVESKLALRYARHLK